MTREEFIGKLRSIYVGEENAIDEIISEYDRLNNVTNDLYEFVEWHYKDNKEFYKGKGMGLNYPETDYVLDKLKALKEDNNGK